MKRLIAVVVLAVLMAGCGKQEEAARKETKKQSAEIDYVAKGFEFLKNGDVVSAIKSFDEAIRQDPQNPEKYITLAQVYYQLKYYPGAISTLHAALKIDPMNAEAYYLLAASYHLQNMPEDRLKAIEAAKRSMQISLIKKDRESFEKARQMYITLVPGEEVPGMNDDEAEPVNEEKPKEQTEKE